MKFCRGMSRDVAPAAVHLSASRRDAVRRGLPMVCRSLRRAGTPIASQLKRPLKGDVAVFKTEFGQGAAGDIWNERARRLRQPLFNSSACSAQAVL